MAFISLSHTHASFQYNAICEMQFARKYFAYTHGLRIVSVFTQEMRLMEKEEEEESEVKTREAWCEGVEISFNPKKRLSRWHPTSATFYTFVHASVSLYLLSSLSKHTTHEYIWDIDLPFLLSHSKFDVILQAAAEDDTSNDIRYGGKVCQQIFSHNIKMVPCILCL